MRGTLLPYLEGAALLLRQAIVETTTAHLAALTDNARTVLCTDAAAVTVTIPVDVLPAGWASMYYATGAGGLSVALDTGVTEVTMGVALDTVAQGEGIYVEVVAPNEVIFVGGTS